MIDMDNGTKVFFQGEWTNSKRVVVSNKARIREGGATTKVIDGMLIVWPADVPLERRREDTKALYRIAGGAAEPVGASFL
jgi:hypothetical protein